MPQALNSVRKYLAYSCIFNFPLKMSHLHQKLSDILIILHYHYPQVILVSLLKEPIHRSVYDFIVKSQHVVSLFDR